MKVDNVVVIAPVPTSAPAIEQAAIELGRSPPNGLWKYFDGDGNLLFATARWNDASGKKQVRPISWVRSVGGAEHFAFKHQDKPRPLYGLHELRLRPNAPVVVVEGE